MAVGDNVLLGASVRSEGECDLALRLAVAANALKEPQRPPLPGPGAAAGSAAGPGDGALAGSGAGAAPAPPQGETGPGSVVEESSRTAARPAALRQQGPPAAAA